MRTGNADAGVESLLLLCCTVGVVAFLCLSMAAGRAVSDSSARPETSIGSPALQRQKKENADVLERLKREVGKLRVEKAALLRLLGAANAPALPPEDERGLRRRLEQLQGEHVQVEAEIRRLRGQLTDRAEEPRVGARKDNEQELQQIEKRLSELDAEIAAIQRQLGSTRPGPAPTDLSAVEAKLDDLKNRNAALDKELAVLAIKRRVGAATSFRNPIYVECRNGEYVFYPEGEVVSVSLAQGELLKKKITGHDIVALLVRPGGDASFDKAHEQVSALGLTYSSEPVVASEDLSFLRSKR